MVQMKYYPGFITGIVRIFPFLLIFPFLVWRILISENSFIYTLFKYVYIMYILGKSTVYLREKKHTWGHKNYLIKLVKYVYDFHVVLIVFINWNFEFNICLSDVKKPKVDKHDSNFVIIYFITCFYSRVYLAS